MELSRVDAVATTQELIETPTTRLIHLEECIREMKDVADELDGASQAGATDKRGHNAKLREAARKLKKIAKSV